MARRRFPGDRVVSHADVLARDPALHGSAQLAQLIETLAVPSLERLRDAPTDAPAA